MIQTTSPRTGRRRDTHLLPSSPQDVDQEVQAALAAARSSSMSSRERRAQLLEAIADAVESHRSELVDLADLETALGPARLGGELTRTVGQFRLFAAAVREGSYLEVAIDHAVQPAQPDAPRLPDVRRLLVPLGVVAVFGASNFPFAFSVLGGDTASAIAAGCTVVIKGHGSHPLTSERSLVVLRQAARTAGFPTGTFGLVLGQQAGRDLVAHPQVRAACLTGSLTAARALQEVIDQRREPIPLFGELSSLNPLLVTAPAAKERSGQIADGLAASVLGSGGQLCTKPGLALVPTGKDGDRLVAGLVQRFTEASPAILLNTRIQEEFTHCAAQIAHEARVLVGGNAAATSTEGTTVRPVLVEVDAGDITPALAEEHFGPWLVVVRYESLEDALAVVDNLPGSLTATAHTAPGELGVPEIFARLAQRAGRVIHNGYPTGVRVCWSQHHGGPWPATNTQHTSVGTTSMRRWLRPLAFQDTPHEVLPPELRDEVTVVTRRVDGVLELAH